MSASSGHAVGAAHTVHFLAQQFEDGEPGRELARQRAVVRESLLEAERQIKKLARMYRGES